MSNIDEIISKIEGINRDVGDILLLAKEEELDLEEFALSGVLEMFSRVKQKALSKKEGIMLAEAFNQGLNHPIRGSKPLSLRKPKAGA